MKGADVDDEPLARGRFLMGLGITQSEASTMLGLGVSTLRNAKNRVKKSMGRSNGKAKGKR
jgi:transposase